MKLYYVMYNILQGTINRFGNLQIMIPLLDSLALSLMLVILRGGKNFLILFPLMEMF